ncbi:terminase small subunit [Acinetobacter bereziniae]|uniref:terminase small subunit n=1 Tax=Acinetobacter bereziniae TaxID=106648 RepID=UPI00300B2EF2
MEDIELPKGGEPLANHQHEELAQAFIITGSKKKAGDMAGYTDKSNAWRAMHRDDVQARIKFLQDERAEELGIDAYYVLKNLKSIAERCMQTEQILDKDGMPVFIRGGDDEYAAAYKFEHNGALKANELMMKHLGMLSDKVTHEHTGKDGKPIRMSLEVVFTDESDQSTN